MSLQRFILLGATACASRCLAVESFVPEAFPASRYEAMLEKSPFSVATPVAPPPAEPTKGFASDYYVTGLGKLDDKEFVTVKSRDLSTNFMLFGNEANRDGIALVSVDWSNQRGKSTVTIKKGTEFAKLEFNQAEIANAVAPSAPGAARPPGPGQPPTVRPVNQPQVPLPVTGAVGKPAQPHLAIPRPTSAPQPVTNVPRPVISPTMPGRPAQPQPADTTPNSNDNRRRIRIIGSKQ